MTELVGRGYLIAHTADYLKDNLDGAEWSRRVAGMSPDLQRIVGGEVKPAGWYPITLLNEINLVVAMTVGRGEDERAKEALYTCGRYISREATNTFLKVVLRMLTPGLLVKKLPDVFRRDFSAGRLTAELQDKTLFVRIYEMPGLDHVVVTSAGFVTNAFEAMGKKVDKLKINEWSRAEPSRDGASFELTWKD